MKENEPRRGEHSWHPLPVDPPMLKIQCIGGSRGHDICTHSLSILFIFMQFSAKLCQIIGYRLPEVGAPWEILDPPLLNGEYTVHTILQYRLSLFLLPPLPFFLPFSSLFPYSLPVAVFLSLCLSLSLSHLEVRVPVGGEPREGSG